MLISVALAATAGAALPAAPAAAAVGKPNIVMVVTDDQRVDELDKRTMPATKRLIARKGTVFTDAIVTTPTCCPSRATMLTGQYGHNNGVLANSPGYRSFRDPSNTLPVWLRRAGYRTAHLGKYLNGYQGVAEPDAAVAPGWDRWLTMLSPRRYYGYSLAVNGGEEKFGRKEGDHLTRVLNREASRTIRRFSNRDEPFYLQLDQFAPHTENGRSDGPSRCNGRSVPDPRDNDLLKTKRFRKLKLPKTASFNELDVTDKPSFIRARPELLKSDEKKITKRHACRLASLRAVDRGVKKVVKTLKRNDILDKTVIIFTSDNGYFQGEHRIKFNKTIPYEEALRVPLAIRAPEDVIGRTRPARVKDLVANLDLAPTILDLAGGEPCNDEACRVMDGRSLVGLLKGRTNTVPGDRSLVVEYSRNRDKDGLVCRYAGIRDPARVYVEYTAIAANGGCDEIDEGEMYDLRIDPFQLTNVFRPNGGSGGVQARMDAKLDQLRDCSGIAGRDPRPAEGSYCE